ncbi:MAG: cupin domain-containing protein [Gammaproteobacteria bacterium]
MSTRDLLFTCLISTCAAVFTSAAIADEHTHKMKIFKNAQAMDLSSLNIEGVNAFLSDTVSSNDPDSPISCGFFRMEKGNPLDYTYTYDEAKIIVDGEMTISEENGESFNAVAGDVVYFDKGAKITFTSESYGIGFYCGQRASGEI